MSCLGVILILRLAVAPGPQSHQLAENNVVVRFDGKRREPEAREVLAIAVGARQQLTEKYHLLLAAPVEIRLSATTAEFYQRTGRPWWQASIYQNRVIHLQPVRVLRARGILATTLRHELMHQFVDENTKGNGPAWLYEALAVYNSGEIAVLKPNAQKIKNENLTWRDLENRLQTIKNQEESERLYFQLYHLGRFLEQTFQPNQISALLVRLGKPASLAQACREALGVSAIELEQRWLRYWAKVSK